MFVKDSSRELEISNVSHFFTHLRKCQPPKKVLIINNYHLSVRFQRKVLKIWFKYTNFGCLEITDHVSHQPCQVPKLLKIKGQIYSVPVSHFKSYLYQFVEKLFSLTTQIFFGHQPPSQHILWMKWWLTWKSSHLWGLFLTSIPFHSAKFFKYY